MGRDMAEYGKEQGKARRAAMINGSQIVQLRTNPRPVFSFRQSEAIYWAPSASDTGTSSTDAARLPSIHSMIDARVWSVVRPTRITA